MKVKKAVSGDGPVPRMGHAFPTCARVRVQQGNKDPHTVSACPRWSWVGSQCGQMRRAYACTGADQIQLLRGLLLRRLRSVRHPLPPPCPRPATPCPLRECKCPRLSPSVYQLLQSCCSWYQRGYAPVCMPSSHADGDEMRCGGGMHRPAAAQCRLDAHDQPQGAHDRGKLCSAAVRCVRVCVAASVA